MIFYLVLPIVKREELKSPIIIMDFYISFHFYKFLLHIVHLLFSVYTFRALFLHEFHSLLSCLSWYPFPWTPGAAELPSYPSQEEGEEEGGSVWLYRFWRKKRRGWNKNLWRLFWEAIKSNEKVKPQKNTISFSLSPVDSMKYLPNRIVTTILTN